MQVGIAHLSLRIVIVAGRQFLLGVYYNSLFLTITEMAFV